MVETVATVVLEVAKCFVSPLGHHFGYLRSHNRNFDDLNEGVGKLKAERDKVQRKVYDALKNVEEIEQDVKEWQSKVDLMIDEAEKLIEEKGNNRCFKGLCPDLKTRYKHSKEASTKMEAVGRLLQEEEKFDKVSHPVVHEDIRLESTKDFEAVKSRFTISKNIMDALNDDNVHMVGVYGMGGIGKTTLVKEVGRQAKKDNLFDDVVFVEISENPNINRIQEEIAGRLNLHLDDKATESQRADKLYARLKNEKILLILDNIWTIDLDLETIGIPSQADHGRCKFLLTSRVRDVLDHMGSKSFLIDVLKDEEDWNLFKKLAGDYIENPELKSVAIEVVKECAGLPVAIVTVAKALRSNKELFEWKDALRYLRKPAPENFTGVLKNAYSKIEFSYNKLEDDKLKDTFLLCSLMRNDASISDLFKYVIGLNILGRDIPKMEEARNRVKKWVRQLKDSCLLLDGETYYMRDPREHFSMHDVVRDVALSIACRDQHVFAERNDDFREWPDKDELKKCMKISLRGANVGEPPEGLECPKLEFLHMWTKKYYAFKIPENFFVGMAKLGVLDLPRMNLLPLPSSLCHLINLQTLCLEYGKIGDNVAIIGELVKLKVLSLKGSDFKELPKKISQLTQLRSLDLSYCSGLKVIAPNVISSLSRLEELYMTGCSVQWEVEGPNVEKSGASLDELKDLPHLTTLEIEIKDDKILPKDLFSRELQRYKISIGDISLSPYSWRFSQFIGISRILKLNLSSNICLKEFNGFKNVEGLCFDELKGVKNILYELDEECFPQLRHLCIQNNPNYSFFIFDLRDSIPHDSFLLLESLLLVNLINLEKLCHIQLTKKSFCNLKIIIVRNCCKLENIFSFSQVSCLPLLEEIQVGNCQNIKEIFAVGRKDNGKNTEVIDKFELCQLRFLHLEHLPQLASFCSEINTRSISKKRRKELTIESASNDTILEDELDTPTSLFNKKVFFPNLDELSVTGINCEIIFDSRLPTMSFCYQNLTSLNVWGCERLKYAFPSSIVRCFEQLQRLDISNCRVLKEIVAKVEAEAEAAVTFVFPRLTNLRLWNLPQLETFHPDLHILESPMLKRLEVCWCDNVNVLGSDDPENHLDISRPISLLLIEKINPKLEELKLGGKSIKMISQGQLPENYFSRLEVLKLEDDESTSIPFGILQTFEKLQLRCCGYKEIFSCEEDEEYVGMLSKLKVLELYDLYNLKYMLEQDSKLNWFLQNLDILEVKYCPKLIKLVPSSATFQNLTALKVYGCNGLMNLVTSSTAKSLMQLKEMEIRNCKMVVEIVANEGGAEKDEIVFSKLKLLSLTELESLKSFCSGNYTFKFPSLEEFIVGNCPKMKTFCGGVLSTPRLQKVRKDGWSDEEGCWDSDLNTTIQQLHRTVINSKSEVLNLSGDDVTMVSEGQFPEQYSSAIQILEIIEDESMNLPLKILHRFNNVEKLILKMSSYNELFSCEEGEKQDEILTQIKIVGIWGLSNLMDMCQRDFQVDSILQNLEVLEVHYCHSLFILLPSWASFGNLETLEVTCCDGLRNLLTSSTAKSLVRLENLTIEHCEMMVEVLVNEEGVVKDKIVFSKLKLLVLRNLESLTSFCSGNCIFQFPSLEKLAVTRCLKMKTFCEGVLSTPRLQGVEQLHWGRYEECWEGDLNTTIQKLYKKVNT